MSGLSNAALAVKIDGVRDLVQAYVEHSAEHRKKADRQADDMLASIVSLDKKVGKQNGRIGDLEKSSGKDRLDIDLIKKKPVVVIFDNWKFLIMLTLGLAVIINFINPVLNWVVGLLKGINLEIGL